MTDCSFVATPLCEHLQPKGCCWYCNIQEKVNSHEEYLKHIDKIALCDSDKVIANQKSLQDNIEICFQRIEKIEKFHEKFMDVLKEDIDKWQEQHKEILERLDKIESIIDMMNNNIGKTPHRCPVCDGNGTMHLVYIPNDMSTISVKRDALGRLCQNCQSCEGKGIVWS